MTLVTLLVVVLGIFLLGWLAHWIITSFFPPAVHVPALAIVGVLLLLIALALLFPGVSGVRVW